MLVHVLECCWFIYSGFGAHPFGFLGSFIRVCWVHVLGCLGPCMCMCLVHMLVFLCA